RDGIDHRECDSACLDRRARAADDARHAAAVVLRRQVNPKSQEFQPRPSWCTQGGSSQTIWRLGFGIWDFQCAPTAHRRAPSAHVTVRLRTNASSLHEFPPSIRHAPCSPCADSGTFMQILIADDDAISRRLAMHALTGCGADVEVAEDGHAAWGQIQRRTESTVLILDRQMPGIDGMELCRRARLLPSFPPLYIVMVTSAS